MHRRARRWRGGIVRPHPRCTPLTRWAGGGEAGGCARNAKKKAFPLLRPGARDEHIAPRRYQAITPSSHSARTIRVQWPFLPLRAPVGPTGGRGKSMSTPTTTYVTRRHGIPSNASSGRPGRRTEHFYPWRCREGATSRLRRLRLRISVTQQPLLLAALGSATKSPPRTLMF